MEGQQPDFLEMSRCIGSLGEQVQNCQNLPAIRQGNDIVEAFNRVGRKLDEIKATQLEHSQSLERQEGAISTLTTRVHAK